MQTDPYSIFVEHRPCKVAYLVAQNVELQLLDDIVRYNRKRWGGRYNPIVLTDGEDIDAQWWTFLRQYDPDIVRATLPLSDGLQKKIFTFMSPLAVELHRDDDNRVYLASEPLQILPNQTTVSRIARDFFGMESSLVLFEPSKDAPSVIRTFLERNFGLIDTGPGALFDDKHALEDVATLKYQVGSLDSLNAALTELGEQHRRVVFPSQLCSLPNYPPEVDYDVAGEHFTILVGDTQNELLHLWNRAAAIPRWLRTSFTQLWLPTALATSPEVRPGLVNFLRRFVGATGNQNGHATRFLTCSLDEAAILAVVADLGKQIPYPRTGARTPALPLVRGQPKLRGAPAPSTGSDLYRGHSKEEHLVLTEPDRAAAPRGDCWFADVYIQLRPERFRNIGGTTYLWQFPPRNSLLVDTRFFNRPARIKADGFFSVFMRRTTVASPKRGALVVTLPDDGTVAWALICGRPFDHFDDSVAYSVPFSTTQSSDKGQTLAGVLSLFPDLLNAHHLFEQRLWRRVFDSMSNQSDAKDEAKAAEVYNALKKHYAEWERKEDIDTKLRLLAGRAINIAKTYSLDAVELRFADFIRLAVAEAEDYNTLHPDDLLDISSDGAQSGLRTEMKEELSGLIEWRVLLAGFRPKCPTCGFRIWYHVNEAAQEITCNGCGSRHALAAEEPWHYQLNSLVRAAVARHGTIPVLLAIGQLMNDARSSFIFVPPADILADVPGKPSSYTNEGDLDLVCLVDGKFVIGEVKKSTSLYTTEVFDKILRIAKTIKPDRVLFSALDGESRKMITDNINRLRGELAPLEVSVEWYPLREWTTAPSPLRWPAD
jgi:hypothetical protein